MRLITKLWATLLLLCVAGVANAAKTYEVDQKFTSVAALEGQAFAIVNEAEAKAVFGSGAQNLGYDAITTAVTGSGNSGYYFKVEAVEGGYLLRLQTPAGEPYNIWGSPGYLNSGAPGGFDGCFILGLNNQNGQDVENGAVWEIEYDADKGFALKNKALGGYFAGPNPAPTATEPIYWTFCTLKEGEEVPDPEPVVIPEPEAPLAEGELIPDFFSICDEGGIPYGYDVKFGNEDRAYPTTYTGGARIFNFAEGGDFTKAIYYREGYVQYGNVKKLALEAGKKYIIYFNSAMWKESGATLEFTITKEGVETALVDSIITNAPNVNGAKDAVTGSTRSEIEFTPEADGNYILKWDASGWKEVLLANVGVKVAPAVTPTPTDEPTIIDWVAGDQNYTNQQDLNGVEIALDAKTTMTCAKGTGSTTPKYYTTGSAVRTYGGNTITFKGEGITKIIITGVNGKVAELTASTGELTKDGIITTWKGEANEIVLTNSTSDQQHIAKLHVVYGGVEADIEPVHIANTAETAYTVAKAIELIDAGDALDDTVFVKGIICQVDTFIEKYKSISYWISEDGTTNGAQFECYSGKDINGADFAAIEDVEVGAEVIVTGLLTKYKETYEFKANNELVSYKAPFKPLFADGKYYIYNVGAQKYLAAGANWGTHAVVNADGLDYTLTQADGKYTLDSQVSNGGNNHFLNGEWNDGAAMGWTFAPVEGAEGVYTISDGTNFLTAQDNGEVTLAADATAAAAQWTLKTLEARIAELATATAEAPVNATFLIQDANFGRNDLRKSAWKMEASNQNLSGGNNINNNAESYHSVFTLSQTLTNAPAGVYQMTAQGFYRQDDEKTEALPVFYANEKTAEFPAKTGEENSMSMASESFTAGLYTIEPIEFIVFEDGQLTIGAKGTATSQWVIFDNFRLTYLSSEIPADEFKPAYENALAAAQAALADEAYAAVTGEEKTALQQAIDDNKEIAEPTSDLYKAAISALNAATSNFTGAKGAYEALTAAKTAKAEFDFASYAYASADKKTAAEATLTADATSAADATAKTEAIDKAFRLFVESNALLESVDGAKNCTDSIKNPNAEEAIAEPWVIVKGEGSGGSLNILDGEPLTDGEGSSAYKYFDGGNWGASAWDVALEQKIALPAGKYYLTVAGRASADVELKLYAGNDSVKMDAIGASGALFGRGWNDASVEFELADADSIVIGVRGVTSVVHNWMSFTRFRLMKFPAEVEPQPQPVDPDLVEIPQDQQDQEAGVVTLATFEKDEKTGVTTYTTKDQVCVIFKMKNVDVSNCDYILFKFAEPTPEGLKYAFWTNNKNSDLPAGVTEFKYVFAEDNENEIKDGIIPEVSLLTIFAEAGKVVKVKGVYKHQAPVEVAHTWDFTKWSEATVANLKADAAASIFTGWSDVEKDPNKEGNPQEPTEASKDNCFWATIAEGGELTANGVAIEELKGLQFEAAYTAARSLAIAVNYPETSLGTYNGPAYLWLGGKQKACFTIPAVKGGTTIKMGVESHKPAEARGVQLFAGETELMDAAGNAVAAPTTYTEQTWQVPAGVAYDIVVKNTNGCHIYFIDAEQDQEVLTSISTVKTNKQLNGTIFNLNGQKVTKAQKGLYIINGKKVVIK